MRRKQVTFLFLFSLMLLTLLPSCGTDAPIPRSIAEIKEAPSKIEETLSITDDLDRTVSIPRNPERVAALLGSFTDVWVLAGGLDTLAAAADDAWTSFGLPLGENVRNLGGVLHLNLEELLAAEPDLVIASCDTAADMDEPTTFLDIFHQIQVLNLAKRLAQSGKAVALVLHDLPLAFSFADRVALLHEGQLLQQGTPEDLIASDRLPAVFGVDLRKIWDGNGWQYYCVRTAIQCYSSP